MHDLISLIGGQRVSYLSSLACAIVLSVAEAALHPILLKYIFDTVLTAEDLSAVVWLCVIYFLFGLAINILSFLLNLWHRRIENRISAELSASLLASFYKKDFAGILKHGEGDYLARIRTDVKDGVIPALSTFRSICVGIAMFIALVAVLLYLSWQAFVILAVIIPVATYISIKVSGKIRDVTNRERDYEASVVGVLSKAISSYRLVNIFNLRRTVANKFEDSMKNVLDTGYHRFKLVNMLRASSDLVMVISDSASMFVGAFLVFMKQMTIGSFIAFMNAFWRSTTALMSIFNSIAEFHNYNTIIARIIKFHSQDLGSRYWADGTELDARDISFRYDGDEPVFRDLNFSMQPGEKALIIGENGSGKSTFANILSGMLKPTHGVVTLPKRISAVTLPVAFPPISIADFDIDSRLLHSFGLEHKCFDRETPSDLSIGQQQKLAIALALNTDADLYVFDEPLANLDTQSRKIALEEIFEKTKNAMLIMIMHDAHNYVSSFDRVLELDGAKVDA